MMNEGIIAYNCPSCGQGGLRQVKIGSEPPQEAVICAECDRVWLAPAKVSFVNNETVDTIFPSLGIEPTWEKVETISQGVPWDRLDKDFQSFLQNTNNL
jgi:uncharacterized Zn finger protein